MGTSTPASRPDSEWDAEALKDWVVSRSKPLMIGGAVVLVAIAAVAFSRSSAQRKNARAESALMTGQSAFYSGNTAQAKTDLGSVISRYPGTASSTQAAMLLAQIHYNEGKHDEGLKILSDAAKVAPGPFRAAVAELMAAGYADTKRYAEAAEHFSKAAELAEFPTDKEIHLADAARVLLASGKVAESKKIWEKLAANPESVVRNEAKVRLGEIEARPVSP
jgi:tetratricopeptide (TPR) repeat protein